MSQNNVQSTAPQSNLDKKLDGFFKISERGSSVKTEMIAGLTTFLAMVYSVIVVPSMLGAAGFDTGAVFVATCLVAAFGSLLMGLWVNLPMAIGCAISLTAFTAFSLVLGQGVSIPVALGAVFIMGALFTLITVTGVRQWILNNLPTGIAHGTGIGIGLIHYIDFSYNPECNCYTTDNYFNDHFKLRSEISWNKTKLNHYGQWADRPGPEYDKLRNHSGEANNFDIGMQLEYFPLSIREFQSFGYRFAPFVSLGAHFTAYNPSVSTSHGNNDINDPNNFFGPWMQGNGVQEVSDVISDESGSAWSMVTSVGVRYKLTALSDLMLDLRWQLYFNDWVDGLNHRLESNDRDDWLVWLNFGYIYYLD